MPFSKLGLAPVLCSPLSGQGYRQPTPVQEASIPLVLEGVDLLARAQTGTGKTAAFGLPMIDRLFVRNAARPSDAHRAGRAHAPRALVLVPTRELAVQVQRALARYGAPLRLRVTEIVGGMPMGRQVQALRRGTDIVVATPGRLIDHMGGRTIDLSAIEILTLDEADRMLDMGFLPPLRRIVSAVPRARQTLLFSATFSSAVAQLSSEFTREPRRVDVSGGDGVAPTVTHSVHPVAPDRKRALLQHVLTQTPGGQALVFCKTKRGADRVGEYLDGRGMNVAVIHGNKSQGARSRSLADFKLGKVAVLVATDVAARGLDIAQLPLVVNYDLPLVAEDYVHRVGRTGRAGHTGRAVSLVTTSEAPLLRGIQRLLPTPLDRVVIDGYEGGFDEGGRARRTDTVSRPARVGTTSAVRNGGAGHRHRHHRNPHGPRAAAAPRSRSGHGHRADTRSAR